MDSVLTKKDRHHKEIPIVHSLCASDSFMNVLLPALHRFQARIGGLCPDDEATGWEPYAKHAKQHQRLPTETPPRGDNRCLRLYYPW